jgi:hypothetical protein
MLRHELKILGKNGPRSRCVPDYDIRSRFFFCQIHGVKHQNSTTILYFTEK